MKTTFRFLLCVPAAAVLLVVSACGNKGPLVMPQTPVQIEEQVVAPEPAPEPSAVDDPVDEPQAASDDKDE